MDVLVLGGCAIGAHVALQLVIGGLAMATDGGPHADLAHASVRAFISQDEQVLANNLRIRWLAACALGTVLVIATVGIVLLSFCRLDIPPALSGLAGTAIGALVPSITIAKRT